MPFGNLRLCTCAGVQLCLADSFFLQIEFDSPHSCLVAFADSTHLVGDGWWVLRRLWTRRWTPATTLLVSVFLGLFAGRLHASAKCFCGEKTNHVFRNDNVNVRTGNVFTRPQHSTFKASANTWTTEAWAALALAHFASVTGQGCYGTAANDILEARLGILWVWLGAIQSSSLWPKSISVCPSTPSQAISAAGALAKDLDGFFRSGCWIVVWAWKC